jgi:hypothetical protein
MVGNFQVSKGIWVMKDDEMGLIVSQERSRAAVS